DNLAVLLHGPVDVDIARGPVVLRVFWPRHDPQEELGIPVGALVAEIDEAHLCLVSANRFGRARRTSQTMNLACFGWAGAGTSCPVWSCSVGHAAPPAS